MLSDSYYKASVDKMVKLLLQRNVKTYMYVLNSTLDGLKGNTGYNYGYLENGMFFFICFTQYLLVWLGSLRMSFSQIISIISSH